MQTKWSILNDRLAEARETVTKLQNDLVGMQKTPFADGHEHCPVCDELLYTEADFAKHYIVPDSQYPNLGYCPQNVRNWRGKTPLPKWASIKV